MEILRKTAEAQRLKTLSQYEILDSPPELVFDGLTKLAADICNVPISLISFLDQDREWFKSHVGLSLQEFPRDHAFSSHAIRGADVFVVPDARKDERFSQNALVTGELGIRFYAGYPLFGENGCGLGTISVMDRVPHELTSRQLRALRMLGKEAMLLLEFRREIYERRLQNERQSAELAALRERLSAEQNEPLRKTQTEGNPVADDGKKMEIKERDLCRAIVNSLPGIFYLLDETGLNLHWNENLEKITGYSAGEIKKMHASDFVDESEKPLLAERIKKVFVEGEGEIQINLISKDGKRTPYFCTGKRIYFKGEPRLVGMGIDISKRLQAEAEVRKLNQELEERVSHRTLQLNASNKDLQSFSYTVSHDLKAPLRAILGFAQALDQDSHDVLNEEHRVYLQRISQAANRMTQLIEDLLNYSKIGRTAVQLRPVQLQEFVQNIADDYAFPIRENNGTISIANDLPVITTDPTLLSQVFSNIFENAIVYRSPDRPVQINLTWRKEKDAIVICIADNGIGIEHQHQRRIFEVFQRLHTNDQFPGTGIGLANAKKAVETLGGEIWVESQPGRGSTFCIKLKLI